MRHGRKIHALARRMLGDDALAEDATQEVFLQAFRNLGAFRRDAQFSTWLRQIAHNVCVNRLRAQKLRRATSMDALDQPLADPNPAPGAEALLDREDLQQDIQRALDRMEPEHRLILVLRVLEEKSYAEIARLTDQSEVQVRGKLYRARKAFLEHFTR